MSSVIYKAERRQREQDSPRHTAVPAWLRLAKPIAVKLGEEAMLMLDLGRSAALLSGRCDYAPGTAHDLAFSENGFRVKVRCLVTAAEDHALPPVKDVLVRFLEQSGPLSELIAAYEAQIRHAEEANASGNAGENVIDGDRMLSDLGAAARSHEGFLRCRLDGGRWSRDVTVIRDQPRDGFTVSAAETEDQIELLLLAYEESDEAGRQLLREFAAASVSPAR